jgi:adenosylhomocysteine nucleosidase
MERESSASAPFPTQLVVMALEIEAGDVFQRAGIPVMFTGIGKVNATYALTKRIAEYRQANAPLQRVINFGTAGSHRFPTGTLVACNAFIQRDIDLTALGFAQGVTPFEPSIPAKLECPPVITTLPQAVCSSGDSFETCDPKLPCDVTEMEAYALAKVCLLEKLPFVCVKYITDGTDASAANDWQVNVKKAAAEFLRVYRDLPA